MVFLLQFQYHRKHQCYKLTPMPLGVGRNWKAWDQEKEDELSALYYIREKHLKNYVYGSHFVVCCCCLVMVDLPIPLRVTSLVLVPGFNGCIWSIWVTSQVLIAPIPLKQPWTIWTNASNTSTEPWQKGRKAEHSTIKLGTYFMEYSAGVKKI